MIDITPILEAFIVLISAILCSAVVPALKKYVNKKQFEEVIGWVQIAVKAAEQTYQGTGNSKKKKNYVKKFLESKGFTFDEEELDKLIESQVYDVNLWKD